MKKTDYSLKDLRQFGLVLSGISAVFCFIHFLRHHILLSKCFFGFYLAVLTIAIFMPKALKPAYAVFLKTAHAIGWFNTRAILILIYFGVLTPIGLVMRIFNKDPLNTKIDKSKATYWVKKPKIALAKERLEKQF